jgi:hypothetical protein
VSGNVNRHHQGGTAVSDPIADTLRRQAEAAKALIQSLRGEDEETIHDTTEGETGIMEAIDTALVEMDECAAIVAGCKAQIAVYQDRASTFDMRAARIRALIEQAMTIADLPTAKRPAATVTVKRTPPKPVIADESLIPSRFFKTPAPVIDKAAINAAIKDGESVPGVQMDNGGISLQIRRV